MFKFVLASILLIIILPQMIQFSNAQEEPVNFSKTDGESIRVQLLVDGNNVYTVWSDDSNGGVDDVFFAKSNDGGKNFDKPINLSQNDGSSAFPRIAISESNVYVTWYDYSPGQSDIFFAKSNDGGNSFEIKNLSNTPMPSYNPWIAAFSNYVFIAFNDGGRSAIVELPDGQTRVVDISTGDEELVIFVSEDYGETFKFTNLSNSEIKLSWNARLATSEPNVYVTWNEMVKNQSDIFFSKSLDNGKSFSKPKNLSNTPYETVDSAIGIFENNVYVIWNEKTKNGNNIFFSKSDNNGETFAEPINLSNTSSNPIINRDGSLAISQGKIFLVWYDELEEENFIYFTKSTDDGITFSNPINLNDGNEIAKFSQVVANDENVYVVWQDNRLGNGEIFLRESNDFGESFSEIKNISNDELDSKLFILGPQIALSEDHVYSVWQAKSFASSDLFITSFLQNQNDVDNYYELSTLDDIFNIEIAFESKPDVNEPSSMTFRFIDPKSEKLLNKVDYSMKIVDSNGQKITEMNNLFAEAGIDNQVISFPKSGPYNLIIDINGIEGEIDSASGKTASLIFTVVPEFPIGLLMTIGMIFGFVIIISFSKIRTLQI